MVKMEKETRLTLAIVLSLIFMCIEIVGGYFANSIAIFSDAAHLLTDIAGFVIALIATIAAKSPGTKTLTFGMARAEVFGALGSILSLWMITAVLLYEAFFRALAWFEGNADPVDGFLMFAVACFGVLVNLCLGFVFHEDHGGAFHPAHSHDHGHASHGSDQHGHGHGGCSSSHGGSIELSTPLLSHGAHDKKSEHGHSHAHTESTPLLPNVGSHVVGSKVEPFAFTKAAKCTGHSHDSGSHHDEASESPSQGHDHSHGHGHGGHDESHSHSAHDHSDKDLEAAHGKSGHGHGHDHGHGHEGNYGSAHSGHDHGGHSSDVNLEAAYLHVLTDLIQSIGVALAGAVLWWKPHWQIIDPVCTVLFSIVALNSTLPLINRVAMILFEGTPSNVSYFCVEYASCLLLLRFFYEMSSALPDLQQRLSSI